VHNHSYYIRTTTLRVRLFSYQGQCAAICGDKSLAALSADSGRCIVVDLLTVRSCVLTLFGQSLINKRHAELLREEKALFLGGNSRGQTTPVNHAQSTGHKTLRPEMSLHELQHCRLPNTLKQNKVFLLSSWDGFVYGTIRKYGIKNVRRILVPKLLFCLGCLRFSWIRGYPCYRKNSCTAIHCTIVHAQVSPGNFAWILHRLHAFYRATPLIYLKNEVKIVGLKKLSDHSVFFKFSHTC
jgi:hypothetical protein